MKTTNGFKARASVQKWSVAPTGRARCRVCKGVISKGQLRLETCAFVMPGRRTVFMTHARCVTAAQVADMMRVYKSVDRVPVGDGVCHVQLSEVLTRTETVRSKILQL